MNKYKYNLGILLLLFLMSSCSDFLDVNTDPTRVSEDDVTLTALLPTVIERTASAHYSTAVSATRVTHQLDHIQSGYYGEFSMSGAWSNIYLRVLQNADIVIKKADAEGSPHYSGIAQVLKAVNLGLLTDSWENVPYAEALDGSGSPTPSYDTQQEIYNSIQTILDGAISNLAATDNFRSVGSDDMIYGGDVEKWTKLAHSLKARYMLHLSNKSDNKDAILAELALGMTSNDDNFALVYDGLITNPWYFTVAKKLTEAIFTYNFGSHLVNSMNGEFYTVFDPRLPIIADADTFDVYIGLESYNVDAPGYTVLPTSNTYYFASDAPLSMMNYSEVKFIEAEVLMAKGGDATAAYTAGIGAHMDELGVDSALKDAYLADANVTTVDLAHIMKEKYIALMLNSESWNDMRRHNFSSSVFTGFVEPDFEGRNQPGQRALYPDSEQSRNKANFESNTKEFTEKMWKDQ